MSRVRKCDKCGSMADSSRTSKLMVLKCSHCGYKVTKRIINKGGG